MITLAVTDAILETVQALGLQEARDSWFEHYYLPTRPTGEHEALRDFYAQCCELFPLPVTSNAAS